MIQIVLKKNRQVVEQSTSIIGVCTSASNNRMYIGTTVFIGGLSNYYSKAEVDTKILETLGDVQQIEYKTTTIEATENQVFFDMGENFSEEFSVSRNGVDLKEGIFSIVSPYFEYNQGTNGNSPISLGDILIFKYI